MAMNNNPKQDYGAIDRQYEQSKQITNAKLNRTGKIGKPHPSIKSLPPKRVK